MRSTIAMGRSVMAGLLFSWAALGCTVYLPGDEGCRDVGYSIANKSFECNGDIEQANASYSAFMRGRTCLITKIPTEAELGGEGGADAAVATPYTCSASLLQLTCAQVARYGDDYDRWLANGTACTDTFTPKDGGVFPERDLPDDVPPPPPEPSFSMTVAGTIASGSIDQTCTGVEFVPMICHDPEDNSDVVLTLRKVEAGDYTDLASIDARVIVQFALSGSYSGINPGDTLTRLSLRIADVVVSDDTVSYSLDYAVTRTSPWSVDLAVSATVLNQPCGSPSICP